MVADNRLEDDDDDGGTIIDDGFSTCDEENLPYHQRMTALQAAIQRQEDRKYKCCTVSLLFITILMGVIVACLRLYSNPRLVSNNETGGKTFEFDIDLGNGYTEKENEERFQQTLEYLEARDVSDPATLELEVDTDVSGVSRPQYTPQYQAALWIAKQDKLRISIPSTNETSLTINAYRSQREYPFLQRYALAVFYFSTGGPDWHEHEHFMTGLHECDWKNVIVDEGNHYLSGTYCDGDVEYAPDDLWKGKHTVTRLQIPCE